MTEHTRRAPTGAFLRATPGGAESRCATRPRGHGHGESPRTQSVERACGNPPVAPSSYPKQRVSRAVGARRMPRRGCASALRWRRKPRATRVPLASPGQQRGGGRPRRRRQARRPEFATPALNPTTLGRCAPQPGSVTARNPADRPLQARSEAIAARESALDARVRDKKPRPE